MKCRECVLEASVSIKASLEVDGLEVVHHFCKRHGDKKVLEALQQKEFGDSGYDLLMGE